MKKYIAKIFVSALPFLLLTGCTGTTTSDEPFNTEIMFIGSSTLAPIVASLADDFMEVHNTWDNINSNFPNAPIAINVTAGGTGPGVRAIVDNTADFAMLARNLRESETEEIEDAKEFLVGIDALTVAVNKDNPLAQIKEDLTREQIVNIFSGEYLLWQDIDPSLPADEIVVIIRDAGGSAPEVFQSAIMSDVEVRIDAIQAPSMGALVTRLLDNPNAIGYPSYGFANQHVDDLFVFSIDTVKADIANIVGGYYPLQRPLVIASSGEPSATHQYFIDFITGELGQQRVYEFGFVPVN